MVVLVRLVKRDKLRFRTALRSWMPRRGATIIGRGCLQNPVMLHDDMMSQFLGHCQVLGNLRSFSVANRFQKAALIAVAYQLTTEDPWCRTCRSEACNLIRHSPASAAASQEQQELREVFTKLDANGRSEHSKTYSLVMRWRIPLFCQFFLAKPHPFRFQALFARMSSWCYR